MNDDKLIRIGQAARIIGVHPQSIKNYEQQGYITSSRTPGGHRRYRLADVLRITHAFGTAPRLTLTATAEVIRNPPEPQDGSNS